MIKKFIILVILIVLNLIFLTLGCIENTEEDEVFWFVKPIKFIDKYIFCVIVNMSYTF